MNFIMLVFVTFCAFCWYEWLEGLLDFEKSCCKKIQKFHFGGSGLSLIPEKLAAVTVFIFTCFCCHHTRYVLWLRCAVCVMQASVPLAVLCFRTSLTSVTASSIKLEDWFYLFTDLLTTCRWNSELFVLYGDFQLSLTASYWKTTNCVKHVYISSPLRLTVCQRPVH